MYVLIIARGYPSEKYKMNGIFEFDQAKALWKAGIKVVFAAVDTRSLRRWRKWGFEKAEIQGIPCYIHNIPLGRFPEKTRERIQIRSLRKLYQKILAEQGKPDIIHTHFIDNGFIALEALGDADVPIIHTEHFRGMLQKEIAPFYFALGKATYPRIHRVLAVSPALAENIRAKFGVAPVVVPNVAELGTFQELKQLPGKQEESPSTFRFVCAGGLTKVKRMDYLIEAFHQAFSNDPQVKLTIFGEGPMRKKLETMIDDKGLKEQVVLKGLVSRDNLAGEYQQSDAFVLASSTETFGLSFIEAMAAGLPVIATRSGGPDQFVTKDRGFLVAVDSKDELVQALRTMRDQHGRFDRKRIADSVQAQFSDFAISRRLTEIYKEVTEQKK